MTSVMDSLIKCGYCNNTLRESCSLPCTHNFCKSCIVQNVIENSLKCKSCSKTYSIANKELLNKVLKKSFLSDFFLSLNSNYFENLKLSDDEKTEQKGICPECPPPPVPLNENKKGSSNSSVAEPLLVTLLVCFHCRKKLCESCRNRHYIHQRHNTTKLLEECQNGSSNILTMMAKLNEARKTKIDDYNKYKIAINEHKLEMIKQIDQEEKMLLDKLNQEILCEQNKMKDGNNEMAIYEAKRDLAKIVKEKIFVEKNKKKLSEMCNEFVKANNEWKMQLQYDANRIDPSKEMKLVFTGSKIKENLIGSLENRKENLKLKRPSISSDNNQSSLCSII